MQKVEILVAGGYGSEVVNMRKFTESLNEKEIGYQETIIKGE